MTDNWLERTELLLGAEKLEKLRAAHVPVSYTHLTLPTIA